MTAAPGRHPDEDLLAPMVAAARAAGAAILEIYRDADHGITRKQDDSPLTRADIAAHHLIRRHLRDGADLPLLSEESRLAPWEERRHWRRYWLVDPLDGTREFIRRNGEFTVNIALVDDGVAVLGVILAPVPGRLYIGQRLGDDPALWRASRQVNGAEPEAIGTRPLVARSAASPFTLVASSRHGGDHSAGLSRRLASAFGPLRRQTLGSSLKMCLIAEGSADLYLRLGPAGEWDTAAAQAIVEAAGGQLCDLEGAPRRYNRRPDAINPAFYAVGDAAADWPGLFAGLRD